MRQTLRGGWRRTAALAVTAALVVSVVGPSAALAATARPALYLSSYYQAAAAPVKIYGTVAASPGAPVRLEMRKPGRTYWSLIATTKTRSNKRYTFYYEPKLAGKFYIRTRHGTTTAGVSRTVALTVAKGPGVKTEILLASTTSTRDSGLFERLGPAFLKSCPEYTLKATFVGSGAAIALGGSGDADVLLTHSPSAEVAYMNGFVGSPPVAAAHKGRTRYKVMYNDYVLVGPTTITVNPASILATEPAVDAFAKIASSGSTFWSRNDNSGTNAKEKEIWALLGNPQIETTSPLAYKSWYKASGVMGMAQALSAAGNASSLGYTLADRGTWLNAKALGTTPNLGILNHGDARYFNQYSVIEVSANRNFEGGQDFSQWIRSPEAQELIRTYGEYTYPGQTLFVPNQGSW